jgi:hypothetical protein
LKENTFANHVASRTRRSFTQNAARNVAAVLEKADAGRKRGSNE